ncbi:MAG: two-component regulator propeller domain-containing protein, partial [Bacteroidota bacterium]
MRNSFYWVPLLALFPLFSWAQQYSFLSYSIEQGLAQTQVRSLLQDQRGYIWVGTLSGGVSRFDGLHFRNFSKEHGLQGNEIMALTEAHNGDILLGTKGGISRFNGTSFANLHLPEEASSATIFDVKEDNDGQLWLATDGSGVFRYDGQEFTHFATPDSLAHDFVRTILVARDGRIWFGTRNGLSIFDGQRMTRVRVPAVANISVSDLMQSADGTIWISTYRNDGVFAFDGTAFTNYRTEDGLIQNYIRSMVEDARGNIWFASRKGISKLHGNAFQNFRLKDGLPIDNIYCLLEDNEGNLWLGSNGGGLLKFSGEMFVSYTERDGLSSELVMAFLQDRNNDLWFSTYDAGITRFQDSGPTYYNVENRQLSNNTVWSSFEDRDGNLWFGTSGSLNRFDGRSWERFLKADGLASSRVFAIAQDDSGTLWFGTKDGISRFDGSDFANNTEVEGTVVGSVRDIHIDRQQSIWFATSNGVLAYRDQQLQRVAIADSLGDLSVNSIAEEQNGQLWFGTANGLQRYDGTQFQAVRVGNDPGSNRVNSLVFDQLNHLWIGTDNGLFEFDLPHYRSSGQPAMTSFTRQDGVIGLECNQNAAYADREGHLWFGTGNGVVRYDPAKKPDAAADAQPFIHLTQLQLFLEETDWGKRKVLLDERSGLPIDPVLRYDQNYLTFAYTGISHSNPEKLRYQFKLEGFDANWLPVTDATFATYSNLPHGSFTFKVRAVNDRGVWSASPAEVSFVIRPPFWL